MNKKYHRHSRSCRGNDVQDMLEGYVREGARRMLAAVLEEEVSAYLARDRSQRSKEFQGYHDGYQASRELTVGPEPVDARVPRVSDVPPGVGGFGSRIGNHYERNSKTT